MESQRKSQDMLRKLTQANIKRKRRCYVYLKDSRKGLRKLKKCDRNTRCIYNERLRRVFKLGKCKYPNYQKNG